VRLRLIVGGLAACDVDAVVRVTGRNLARHTDDEVLAGAGPDAVSACRDLARLSARAGLPAGAAVTTTAGALPARWIVHVHVPRFDLHQTNEHLLRQAYRGVLQAADAVGARSLAVRPLGTSDPYWPLEIAVRAATGVLPHTPTHVSEVQLVLRTAAALEPFAEALARR
jgi:O-acetyl-ADP-ribose deacetylase (regulator of RNase III)